jgi:hypothetical protein
MLFNINEEEQNKASEWFTSFDSNDHINIYFCQNNDNNVPWILHAMASSTYKYIDIDAINGINAVLSGYILGKSNTYYKCSDESLTFVYSHINLNKVTGVADFLERVLGAKQQPKS